MIKVSDSISVIWYSGHIFFQIQCWSKIRKRQEINLMLEHMQKVAAVGAVKYVKLNENIPVSSK